MAVIYFTVLTTVNVLDLVLAFIWWKIGIFLLCINKINFQIVNDHGVGGKCYGFVTFTNPRSAVDAINDMNGRVMLSFSL